MREGFLMRDMPARNRASDFLSRRVHERSVLMKRRVFGVAVAAGLAGVAFAGSANAQMRDTLEKISGNAVNEGIHKNLAAR
jgi:hypothetical protein